MLFNSFSFLLFFPVVLIVYYIIPARARYIWLLLASYYFYMSWNPKYAVLIAFSTIVTWASGILIDKTNVTARKKLVVFICFAVNLAILGFFKYFDFFIDTINVALQATGLQLLHNPFDFLLPVGISFYTFQALGYTIDVYRKEVIPQRNLLKYALFVSFFPQLVAGPIERSKNLLDQVSNVHKIKAFDYDRAVRGAVMMLWGLFMKMVIADRLAIVVDTVYNNYGNFAGYQLAIATICFTFQIYCDFGSYSLIAIGAAKVMGFSLMENFNTPYFALSIKDFWSRWHISLSTWFRDYLYIPLGGNRCSRARNYFNLMVTFLVSGLWHGANWTFVIWGGLHGAFQIIGKATEKTKRNFYEKTGLAKRTRLLTLWKMAVTFSLVSFAWIFFRARTFGQAKVIIAKIFTQFQFSAMSRKHLLEMGLVKIEWYILMVSMIMLLIVDLYKYVKKHSLIDWIEKRNVAVRFAIYIFCICMIYVFGVYGLEFDAAQFIYFQF